VCTSELFELFKLLWSLSDGKQQNKDLYSILPKEYKNILYGIKGLYYKKKLNVNTNDFKASFLKINDIYIYLKSLPIDSIYSFIRIRKLMFNWSYINNITNKKLSKSLADFSTISAFCDKLHLKLCAIYTHILFPQITQTDIPSSKQKNI